jgi:cytoskeleton protein RodZ
VPFGKELQLEREKLGVPLATIAEETKFSSRQLEALEADDFSSLPGGVFQRGIVRSYCRYLGLDEDVWLLRFADTAQGNSEMDWTEFAENVKRTRVSNRSSMRYRWWGVLAMLVALVALGWVIWRYVVTPKMQAASEQRATGDVFWSDTPGVMRGDFAVLHPEFAVPCEIWPLNARRCRRMVGFVRVVGAGRINRFR